MSEVEQSGRATVLVCITCRADADSADSPRAGMALAEATAAAAAEAGDVAVLRVRCLGNCTRGLSAAIRREGAWTYVFGGLDAARDAFPLVTGARLLVRAPDGIMPWRERPESLKKGLISRIPPLDFREESP